MLSHASVFIARACFEHSILLKVTLASAVPGELTPRYGLARKTTQDSTHEARTIRDARGSATGFLIATTYIYAIGAGITAAAGTRLALQLILVKGFKFHPFQLQDMDALYCYFLSLPPCVRIG